MQALSGTGSLRVGAAFIARFMPGVPVYLSNPTWGNHRNIFGDEGVEWRYYRHGAALAVGLGIGAYVFNSIPAPLSSFVSRTLLILLLLLLFVLCCCCCLMLCATPLPPSPAAPPPHLQVL